MKVGELVSRLNKYPKDTAVVIDTSSDYESYSEVQKLVDGELCHSICGETFKPLAESGRGNAVLLR